MVCAAVDEREGRQMITAREASEISLQNMPITNPMKICEEHIIKAAKEGKYKVKVIFNPTLDGLEANQLMVSLSEFGYNTYPYYICDKTPVNFHEIFIYWRKI